jgi:PAS domain S-box-containing protein
MRLMLARHAAIIQNSDDAILSKDLNGIITSWNPGAERIFGYSADEAIGKPVAMLIPAGRENEEPEILARLRRGERMDHYETMRQRKDGELIHISLTVSPIRAPDGTIVGASKIARDVTEQQRARERQELLIREINHRVNNVFGITNAIVALSTPFASSAQALSRAVRERLDALSRAQRLSRPGLADDNLAGAATTLDALIDTIATPYESSEPAAVRRIRFSGPEVAVTGGAVSNLALVIHEFAANAAKYGALSQPRGTVDLGWRLEGENVALTWVEHDGPSIAAPPVTTGFGTLISRRVMVDQFGGTMDLDWRPAGLVARLSIPVEKLTH